MRRPVALAQLQMIGPGEAVEHLHLGRGDRQLAVLVLAVEGKQPPAEQLQVGRRGGAPGDESAGPPARRDPPAENDLLGILGQPLGDLGHLRLAEQSLWQVEDALDPSLLGARPHDLRPGLAPHQQIERVREDGLARRRSPP